MELCRTNQLANDVLLVDGIGRSGKFYMSNLIASFDRVEISQLNNAFDLIPRLYSLGKIRKDAAVIYLQIEADLGLYENMLGRRVNFRKGDSSSIYNYPNPDEYKQRLEMDEGEDVNVRVIVDEPIYQSVTHNALANANLFFDAFDSCKMIYCIRNPIDVIYSWVHKGFGRRIGNDPREIQLSQKYEDLILPIYTSGWEEEYILMNEYERVVKMIYLDMINDIEGYSKLSDLRKENVFLLNMYKFNQMKQKASDKIAEFLETQTTEYTEDMFYKSVNRNISVTINRSYKLNEIVENMKPEYTDLLNKLIDKYNEILKHEYE